MDGWIRLYRQIQKCSIWDSDEPYDMRSAWLYLLLNASYKDGKVITKKKKLVSVERGQLLTSIRDLATKWKWSKGKVSRFLEILESDGMVTIDKDRSRTLLTIVKYSVFQDCLDTHEDTDGTQTGQTRDTDGTATGHRRDSDGTQTGHSLYNNIYNNNCISKEESKEREEVKEIKNREEGKEDILTDSIESVCQTDVRRVVDAWNELQSYGIIPIVRVKGESERIKMLKARIRQYGVDKVLEAIEKIKESDYLQGKNRHNWSIKFDWFVRPNNFPKVLEGNYDNGSHEKRTVFDEWRDA